MDKSKQDKIEELLNMLQNSQTTPEEKVAILKMINASVREFNEKLKNLNLEIKKQ